LQQHEVIYLIVLGFAAAGNAAMLFFASKPMPEGNSRDLQGSAVGLTPKPRNRRSSATRSRSMIVKACPASSRLAIAM
jgi:hypothetical protein